MTSDSIAVVFNNQVYVFVKGASDTNGVYYQFYPDMNGNWSGWFQLDPGGHILGKPAVAVLNSQVYVVVRGQDNGIYWDHASWGGMQLAGSGWNVVTNTLKYSSSDPALTSGYGSLQLALYGTDSQVWNNSSDGVSWNSWNALGGRLVGNPNVLLSPGPAFNIFVHGQPPDNNLWDYQAFWTNLFGYLTNDPLGVVISYNNSTQIHVLARGSDGQLYEYLNGGWHLLGAPAVTQTSSLFS